VASQASLDETVLAIRRHRETDSRHEVDRSPGEIPMWAPVDHCGVQRFTVVCHVGRFPRLVDTGAYFSCIRSDVAEFLYLREEACVFVMFSDTFVT